MYVEEYRVTGNERAGMRRLDAAIKPFRRIDHGGCDAGYRQQILAGLPGLEERQLDNNGVDVPGSDVSP